MKNLQDLIKARPSEFRLQKISWNIGNIFENPEMMEVEPIYAKRFPKKDSNVDYFDYELVNDLIMEKGNEQTRQQWWNFIEKVNHL